jgi:hypothetical protein
MLHADFEFGLGAVEGDRDEDPPPGTAVDSAYDPFRADSIGAGSVEPGVVDPVGGRQGHGAPDQLAGLGTAQRRRVAVEDRVAAAAPGEIADE